jgi:rhodanese-related sulfurtransferase
MKAGHLLIGLLILLYSVSTLVQASGTMVTVVGNSIDLPLAESYLENFRNSGFDVQAITAQELLQHKNDSIILILGGQNAPEGIGFIVDGIMTPREKDEVLSNKDAHVLVVAPNLWASKQKVMVFAGYGKEQTRKLFADMQGDLLKVLVFNDSSLPENNTTAVTVDVPPIDSSQPFTEVDANQANSIIQNIPDVVVIDVRGSPLYMAGHIPGAINLPERQFEQSIGTLDKSATYLLYCGGNSQSIRVGTVMSQNGFTHLYRLVDGYMAWRKAGFPKAK